MVAFTGTLIPAAPEPSLGVRLEQAGSQPSSSGGAEIAATEPNLASEPPMLGSISSLFFPGVPPSPWMEDTLPLPADIINYPSAQVS